MVDFLDVGAVSERDEVLSIDGYLELVVLAQDEHVEVSSAYERESGRISLFATPAAILAVASHNHGLTATVRVVPTGIEHESHVARLVLASRLQVDHETARVRERSALDLDDTARLHAVANGHGTRHVHIVLLMMSCASATGVVNLADVHIAGDGESRDLIESRTMSEVEKVMTIESDMELVVLRGDNQLEVLTALERQRSQGRSQFLIGPGSMGLAVSNHRVLVEARVDAQGDSVVRLQVESESSGVMGNMAGDMDLLARLEAVRDITLVRRRRVGHGMVVLRVGIEMLEHSY